MKVYKTDESTSDYNALASRSCFLSARLRMPIWRLCEYRMNKLGIPMTVIA